MQFYMRNNVFKNNIVYVGEHGRVMSSRSARKGVHLLWSWITTFTTFPRDRKPLNGTSTRKTMRVLRSMSKRPAMTNIPCSPIRFLLNHSL
jgi:hypothetical protein